MTEPLLVDRKTGSILDGHHRFAVAKQLQLKQVPAVLIDYLTNASIDVEVWPGCGRDTITKQDVIDMSLSEDLFPPKTSRHRYVETLPPISVPLAELREEPDSIPLSLNKLQGYFKRRLRQFSFPNKSSLDVVQRKRPDLSICFNRIRFRDPTSSFSSCHAITLEDLLQNDSKAHFKFFASRVTDPTSYFFKYRLEAIRQRKPVRHEVELVDINWLKPHERVQSAEAVHKLQRATLKWNAYIKPLLVDIKTGVILDGHHRYDVGKRLSLSRLPAVLVDYLGDASITVDTWPEAKLGRVSKEKIIEQGMAGKLYPPKTTRHDMEDTLPPFYMQQM